MIVCINVFPYQSRLKRSKAKVVVYQCLSVEFSKLPARKLWPIRKQNRAVITRESTSVVDSVVINQNQLVYHGKLKNWSFTGMLA